MSVPPSADPAPSSPVPLLPYQLRGAFAVVPLKWRCELLSRNRNVLNAMHILDKCRAVARALRQRVGTSETTSDAWEDYELEVELIHSQPKEDVKDCKNQSLRVYPERVTDRVTEIATDPDLDALLAAWPSLPAHVKATILSLVGLLPKLP